MDPVNEEPVEGYWEGIYSDVETNSLGVVGRKFVPYEADNWNLSGATGNRAIRVPFPLNPSLLENEYRPFWETIYDLNGLGRPRASEIYQPTCFYNVNNGLYNTTRVERIRYDAEVNSGIYNYTADAALRTVEACNEEGRAVKKYYDSLGRHVLTYEGASYDLSGGWGVTPTQAYSAITKFYYDDQDRITSSLPANAEAPFPCGLETYYTYDTLSRMTSVQDGDRGLLEYGYDVVGNLVSFQDPELRNDTQFLMYTYDGLNRVTSEFIYTQGGPADLDSARGDTGCTFSAGFDLFGGQVPVYDNSKNKSGKKGNDGKAVTDTAIGKAIGGLFDDLAAGVNIVYHYDEYPSGEPEDGGFDEYAEVYPVGKLTWTEDRIGKKFFYYDIMGRAVARVSDRCYFDNQVLAHEYCYNLGGQLTSEIYPTGTEINYQYDAIGRLINIPGVYGNGDVGVPTGGSGTGMDPGVEAPGSAGFGVPSRISPSLKARRETTKRNPQNNTEYLMAGINPLLDEGSYQGFIYDDKGRLQYIQPNNGRKTTYCYEDLMEPGYEVLHKITFDMPGATYINYEYDYDDSYNITEIRDNASGAEYGRIRTFVYDSFNRLTDYNVDWDDGGLLDGTGVLKGTGLGTTGARAGSGGGFDEESPFPPYQFYYTSDIHYDYDAVGNRTAESRNLGTPQYYTYHASYKNRLLGDPYGNSYTYNANGAVATKERSDSTVFTYSYDYAGRLVRIERADPVGDGDNEGSTGEAPPDETSPTPPRDRYGPEPPARASVASGPRPSTLGGTDPDGDSLDYLDPDGPYVTKEEAWEFTYDGGGSKVLKINDSSSTKYIHDATGRTVIELTNDIRKFSSNVVKNPSFEIYSQDQWVPEGDGAGADADSVAAGAAAVAEGVTEDLVEGIDEFDTITVGDFAYWTEATGEATAGGIAVDDAGPVVGEFAAKLWRPAVDTYDFRLTQNIPIKTDPARTYELRFFARTDAGFTGRAYAHLTIKTGEIESLDGGEYLDVPDETLDIDVDASSTEWREYRAVFASKSTGVGLQLVLDKAAVGTVYFDRVSIAEYQNDLENASFESWDSTGEFDDTFDFDEWDEDTTGGTIETGDGILTDIAVEITRTGGIGAPTALSQAQPVTEGSTYEFTAAVSVDNLTDAAAFLRVGVSGYPTYDIINVDTVPLSGGWERYTGYYVAPADGDLTVTIGIGSETTGTGLVYFEDVGMKEIPEVCDNNDFEDNALEPTDTQGFVGWAYELNGGDILLETSPEMNGAAAKLERDGGSVIAAGMDELIGNSFLDSDPIGNTILSQRIDCLPCTEYEVTIYAKHNIAETTDYYGAFAIVGNITGSIPVGNETLYDGDFVEVFNLSDGSSGWMAYTTRYTSSDEGWFEVVLGLGATVDGEGSFDAVVIRDLTSRRIEYIYAVGRQVAKIEYEGNVPQGQIYYYHHDLLGSPVMLTDIDGEAVWKGDCAPFGETLEAQPVNWGNPYTFLGNEDDGGLMDFGARFYDPRIGRFYSPDPIKDISGANITNPYVYCMNNPLQYNDKYGLRPTPSLDPGQIDLGGV
ncbi:MAG: RHS repeat-associated core domain-containing protein, partial [Candidatus Zixiibacteriota bacterium]